LCVPPAPHSAARLAQYRAANDLQARLRYASWWVEAKIANAARVLQRLASNRSGISAAGAVTGLRELTAACRDADTLDGIRGYEGAAAALYFETLDSFFPPDCPFERRSRRPPHNAANAVLSFAYAILGAEMEGGLYAAGLDPALGLYHETEDRRPALALDFIEPLRPPVADALALDLLNHGILKADLHFEARDGGVYMNRAGRRRFFIAYERRMTQDFFSEQLQRRTSIRGELRRQAIEFKQSLLEGGAFRPFRMN
jgi:CRISPR-associated protein Cas1